MVQPERSTKRAYSTLSQSSTPSRPQNPNDKRMNARTISTPPSSGINRAAGKPPAVTSRTQGKPAHPGRNSRRNLEPLAKRSENDTSFAKAGINLGTRPTSSRNSGAGVRAPSGTGSPRRQPTKLIIAAGDLVRKIGNEPGIPGHHSYAGGKTRSPDDAQLECKYCVKEDGIRGVPAVAISGHYNDKCWYHGLLSRDDKNEPVMRDKVMEAKSFRDDYAKKVEAQKNSHPALAAPTVECVDCVAENHRGIEPLDPTGPITEQRCRYHFEKTKPGVNAGWIEKLKEARDAKAKIVRSAM